MFDPAFRIASLFGLIVLGSIIMRPGFGENLGGALGNHIGALVFLGLVCLVWRPIRWAIKLFLEGFFLGEGVKHSGVLRGEPLTRRLSAGTETGKAGEGRGLYTRRRR